MPYHQPLCTWINQSIYIPSNPPRNNSQLVVPVINLARGFLNLPADIPVFNKSNMCNFYSFPGNSGSYGDEWIAIDPDFAWNIHNYFGHPAMIGILCHEVGHVKNRQTSSFTFPGWGEERRADYYSGYCLGRLGVAAQNMQIFLGVYNQMNQLYPSTGVRISDVQAGFNRGIMNLSP